MALYSGIHDRSDWLYRSDLVALNSGFTGSDLPEYSNTLESGIQEALTYTSYPREHWLKIRSNNGIERINREIRRRTNAVGAFPDGNSALMLVCARLRFVSASEWGVKTYLNMERLYELEREQKSEKASTSA